MTVSIIIAVKAWQKNLEECVGKCRKLDYPNFEIIILPDSDIGTAPVKAIADIKKGTVPPIHIIPTGALSPAQKRDMAINYAKGEILAFIDDDAWPKTDWLKVAIENFKDDDVAAVGGPAVTPPDDNLRQKASGFVYQSVLTSGKYIYRYIPKTRCEVEDYPSCNFFVRKSIMQELGGFQTNFWPGEDSKLCLDITKRLGKKIIYDARVLVWHHRREIFIPHLKQIASYALHRGYFVKKFPQTSMKISFFLPSLFLLANLLGITLSLFLVTFRTIYFLGLSLYLLLVLIFSIVGTHPQERRLSLRALVFAGTILTHLTYGFYFLKGLFSWRLKEEL